jgi:hypothetical protein
MGRDVAKAEENWRRYVYLRENGHLDYVNKANKCDAFVLGDQWEKTDLAVLRSVRRPALTINQTLPTVAALMGEQINSRIDVAVKATKSGPEDVSDALEKLYKHENDRVSYPWIESEVFDDGIITSRGYFDIRLCFTKNMQGQLELTALNPRNVLPDCDAESYDPDGWNDVVITKWMSPLDIAALYNKDDADYLALENPDNYTIETYDSILREYETFRSTPAQGQPWVAADREFRRAIRVIERQFYELTKVKCFVDLATGDTREVPTEWDREKIGMVMQKYRLAVVDMMLKRIRWRVTAGCCVLHEDWSPYQHFTVVPYFPYFRRGKTSGVVEHILGPQELLNKSVSQELHVINTTANSGWKLKSGGLRNMTTEELEQRGAQTGLVMELDDVKSAEKIEPNQIPTGLDRLVYKAQEFIQGISTVNDSTLGDDREDVAAKAIREKAKNNSKAHAKVFDNLNRTRKLLALRALNIFQDYYTEPRVIRIVKDEINDEHEDLQLNTYDEAVGRIVNDLSIGEYDVTITVTPNKDTVQEAEFDQAVAMRELGIQIPDEILIENSNLKSKRKILKALKDAKASPQVQQQDALQQRAALAEIENTEADTQRAQADTALKAANAKRAMAEAAVAGMDGGPADNPQLEQQKMQHEAAQNAEDRALKRQEMAHEAALQADDHAHEQQQTAVAQRHDVGMAQLGHVQSVTQSAVGHKQSLQAQDKVAQHTAAADKRKAVASEAADKRKAKLQASKPQPKAKASKK